jgi:hypothetical protein
LKQRTGTGFLGSGGVLTGRVGDVYIDNAGHLLPMENPKLVAEKVAEWIIQEVKIWIKEQESIQREWNGKQGKARMSLDREFLQALGVKQRRENL